MNLRCIAKLTLIIIALAGLVWFGGTRLASARPRQVVGRRYIEANPAREPLTTKTPNPRGR